MSTGKSTDVLQNDKGDLLKELRSPVSPKANAQPMQSNDVRQAKNPTLNETEDTVLRKKIDDVCRNLKCQRGQDIADIPGVEDLCKLFQQLASHSGIRFDDANLKGTPDFNTFLEMVKKSRSYSCCLNEGCTILETLLRIFQPQNSTQQLTQLEILKELSYLCLEVTDFPKSIKYAQELLNLADKLNDHNFKADADFILGSNYVRQNSFEKALSHLRAYEQHCHETGDELGEANVSWTLSRIARLRHEDETSLRYARDFLEKAKRANDEMLEMKALANLATAYIRLFDVTQSLQFCDECLKLAQKINHVKMAMEAKFQKATVYLVLGENQDGYDKLKECLASLQTDHKDKHLECIVLGNISYAALLLSKKGNSGKASELRKEALELVQMSLSIAESIKSPTEIALAHLNMGLTFMEGYEDYESAIEHFHECFRIGAQLGSARLIHNSYCSLGRAHEAKGERRSAEEYYTKAMETDDPPCTHWGEAENLRFSPDYCLASLYMSEKKWKDAAKCLQGVIQRCKRQGKSVKDSLLKISFNDKLTNPYQYLQYAYLEEEATKDALVVGEEGRARDFYDKLVDRNDNLVESAPDADDLLKISKAHNTAVLFLSQLTVVRRVYCWLIGSDGRIIDVFWLLQDDWKPLNTNLCVTMHGLALQWEDSRTSIEYRGVQMLQDNAVVSSSRYSESVSEHIESAIEVAPQKDVLDRAPTSKGLSGPFPEEESIQSITGTNESIPRANDSQISRAQPSLSSKTANSRKHSRNPIEELSEITNEISELFVKRIEHHLEQLVKESTTEKPSLLIIPHGNTFNIPYAALRLKNGKHLCHQVTLLEAFSFHSFSHSTRRTESTKEAMMEESLIVGNPTNDLPDLPCAQQEAEMIAHLLGVAPLIGFLATRSEVVSRLPTAPIIHFACHGSQDGQSLYLAPEKEWVNDEAENRSFLTVEDVSKLNVKADLVVLSACHTARGTISSEGVLGLARAFLMAGAKSVVTALWAIPDSATKMFMEKLYKNLREMRVADALSATMCQMQEEDCFKHFVHWGSFKVLGANVKVTLPK